MEKLQIKYNMFYKEIKKLTDIDLEDKISICQKEGYATHEERSIFVALVSEKGSRAIDKKKKENNPY